MTLHKPVENCWLLRASIKTDNKKNILSITLNDIENNSVKKTIDIPVEYPIIPKITVGGDTIFIYENSFLSIYKIDKSFVRNKYRMYYDHAISYDGELMVKFGENNTASIIEVKNDKTIATLKYSKSDSDEWIPTHLAINSPKRIFAVAYRKKPLSIKTWDKKIILIRLYDIQNRNLIKEIEL
jgi:hypothetical protein